MARKADSKSTFFMRLYTREYLSDAKVRALSREHRADLVDLWCFCDQEGSIPDAPAAVARLLGITPAAAKKTMAALEGFFRPLEDAPGRLFSPRHRREREEREAATRGHQAGARETNKKRWGKSSHSDTPSEPLNESLSDHSVTTERVAEVSPVSSKQLVHSSLRSECGAELPAAPPAPRGSRAGKGLKKTPRAAKVVPLERSLEEILGGKGSQTWERFWKTVGCWPRDKVPAPKRVAAAWLTACEKEDPKRIYLAALHYRDEFLRPNPRPGGPPVDETRFMRSPLEWLEQEGWVTELVAIDADQPPPEVAHG